MPACGVVLVGAGTSTGAPSDTIGVLFFGWAMFAAIDWLYSKIPVRFPEIKICLSEGGIGWVAGLLDRLDHVSRYQADLRHLGGRFPDAAEVMQRNFWFCTIDDHAGLEQRHRIGTDHIMVESDYPHQDGTWPDTQAIVWSQIGGFATEEIERIAWRNAAELFRHPVPPALQSDPDSGLTGRVRGGADVRTGESLHGGRWVAPPEGGVVDVISPSTEQVIGHAPLASAADVDGAVAAAREAFDSGSWPRTAPEVRAEALASMAAYLSERPGPLAELNIDEAGVPITFAHARELGPVAAVVPFQRLDHVGGGEDRPCPRRRLPDRVQAGARDTPGRVRAGRSGRGCGALTRSGERAAPSHPHLSWAALVTHPGVDRVVFTGSTVAGRAISAACACSFSGSRSSWAARQRPCCWTTHRSRRRWRRSCR